MENKNLTSLSENIQMYLVTIARLRVDNKPVPLSQLAEALSISPVSVNEMCHKLHDQELVVYKSYKGVSLTQDGEKLAYYILRRHRLWEIFLVEKLGFDYSQAHDSACQLEHTTSDLVADRLDAFLKYPSVNPLGRLVPRADGVLPERPLIFLAGFSAGQCGYVISCDVDEATQSYLDEQGIRSGARFMVVSTSENSLLVKVGSLYVSLARTLAESIHVETEETKTKNVVVKSPQLNLEKEESKMHFEKRSSITQMPLHKLKVGQHGIVVRVGGQGPVRRRIMDMGLVSGTEVKVVRVAPLGDPIEFEVKGYNLSLRKDEASNIIVEVPTEETV